MLPPRTRNRTSDFNAILSATKRKSRAVSTDHNKAESMRHAAGLSDGFWKHAVGTAVHVYNMTPISKAEFLMPKEIWSGKKPDISHLCIFGCAAYVHVLKGKR